MITRKMKYAAAEFTKSHPSLWFLAWNALPRMTFLLPHDKSYYGFRHLARPEGGLFLDVGANIGMSAAGFRHLIPTYHVLSIEADRHHEPSLQRLKKKSPNFDYLIEPLDLRSANCAYIRQCLEVGRCTRLRQIASNISTQNYGAVFQSLSSNGFLTWSSSSK